MTQSLELALMSLLRDEYLHSLVVPHLHPGLIVEDVARLTFEAIRDAGTSELGVIAIELRKRINDDEIFRDIIQSLEKVKVPISSHNSIERAIKQLESYVRWRKTATQVEYMSSQDLNSVIPVSDNKVSYDRLIEACTFAISALDDKATFRFNYEEDYLRAKELAMPAGATGVKSYFSLLNESFQYGGYIPGTVNAVTAPPGVGKSTFLVSEAVKFVNSDIRVLHYVLGDLIGLDVCHKYMSSFLGVSLNTTVLKSDEYYYMDSVQDMFSKVVFRVKGSYEVSVDELCLDAMRRMDDFPYQAIIVDYDGNIKSDISGKNPKDNMYSDGGYIYGNLEKLARQTNTVLLVGCQPKPDYWNKQILPLQSPNESSRKQHAIDTLITLSRPKTSIPLGVMHLPKVRRGITGGKVNICYLNEYATIAEITSEERDTIQHMFDDSDNPNILLREWAMKNRNLRLSVDH